ncbi:MAG: 30S ribosomal protein S20 [Bacteroidetes bacterium]|nr:30S ribosomal protein S20 [Bacteroidota bacterium]MBU1116465.1 30S ribosomal protein S20 [Bacteroidota bacterium]MBU1797300.1 30S ribosomal protein S20 [Bacteroidota bacterium]
MAHHKSAKKRIRQSETKRVRNQAALSKMKTLIKKVNATKEKATAEIVLKEAISYIDKSVSKGRLHKNTAARRKSSLTRHYNSLTA